MRKTVAFTLLLLVLITLAGCSKKPADLDLEALPGVVEQTDLFGPLIYAEGQTLIDMAGVDPALVDRGVFALPVLIVHASGYVVALPAAGAKQALSDALQQWLKDCEAVWANYLPDQHDLVIHRLETEIVTQQGTYIVIIISRDNEAVLDAIKSCLI